MPLELPALPSGLPALWADARRFVAAVTLARPGLLWLSLAPVVLALVHRLAGRRATLVPLGRPAAVFALVVPPRRGGLLATFSRLLGWGLLALAAAGPRWGDGDPDGVAVGRDVVLLLDLSRSMTADDCGGPRWRAATAGAIDLLGALPAGSRGAVLVFAAKPAPLVPLTTDLDHLRTVLRELDGDIPPAAVRPDPDAPSGTRLGAALRAAVAAHDPRFAGAQDVVMLSDGDDPAADREYEWSAGVSAARAAGVPVHVVGVGDPLRPTALLRDGRPLLFAPAGRPPEPVLSRLHEDRLRKIAAEGRGGYLPGHRRPVPPAGDFLRALPPGPARELSDDARPQPRERAAGFWAAGLGLLLVSWWRDP